MGVDYEHELSNGWSKWENLVLAGLKDNKDDIKALQGNIESVKLDVALIRQQTQTAQDYGPRIIALETNSVTNDKLKNERRWLIGTAIAAFGSIVLPILITTGFGGFS